MHEKIMLKPFAQNVPLIGFIIAGFWPILPDNRLIATPIAYGFLRKRLKKNAQKRGNL
jgi:hypothetical protein